MGMTGLPTRQGHAQGQGKHGHRKQGENEAMATEKTGGQTF